MKTEYQTALEAIASKAIRGVPADEILFSYYIARKEILSRQIISGTSLHFDANKAAYEENEQLRRFAEEIQNSRLNPESP